MNKYLLALILQVMVLTSPFINAMNEEPIVCQECLVQENDWENQLYRACSLEHSECFKALLQQDDLQPEAREFVYNRSPLHCLCLNGNYELATLLIKYVCDHNLLAIIDLQDALGSTPLHHACSNKHLDIIRLLLVHGADEEIVNNDNQKAYCINLCKKCLAQKNHASSLCQAATVGHTKCLEILLDWSDKERDESNVEYHRTPLHYATHQEHPECVRLLCQHKANPNALTALNRTPLHMLFIETPCNPDGAHAIIQILKEAGADVNARDDFGWTPLSYAYYYKNDEIGDFLKNNYEAVDSRIITFSNLAKIGFGMVLGAGFILDSLDNGNIITACETTAAMTIRAMQIGNFARLGVVTEANKISFVFGIPK